MCEELEKVLKGMDLDFFAKGAFEMPLSPFKEGLLKGEVVLLDVRERDELNFLQFPFALNIPLKELPEKVAELPRDKVIAIYCPGKIRATMAYLFLLTKGLQNVKLLDATSEELAGIFKPPYIKKLLSEK